MKKKWYVVYTKTHSEKKVTALLTKKKIENFCPRNRTLSSKGNSKKWIYEPLFTSLVFIYINDAEMSIVRQMGSVVTFIYWQQTPAIISDSEIEYVRDFTRQYTNIRLEKASVNPTGTAQLISEPHIDINSNTNLVSVKNSHFKLLLPTLGYVMITEIEKSTIDVFNYGFERTRLVS